MTAGEVAERLGGKRSGTGWTARCPAHEDRNPSLSISAGTDGRVLLHCHAGCDHAAVLRAVGLGESDLFTESRALPKLERRLVASYPYRDENEQHLFDVLRYSPKDFRQRKADGSWSLNGTRRVLYRLPEILARPEGAPVFIVEGEKDADTLAGLGLAATCNPGGAGKWRAEYGATLRGAAVVVLADADEPGRRHADQVAAQLAGVAASVRVLELPGAKDVSDWLGAGGSLAELERLAAEPTPDTVRRPADAGTEGKGGPAAPYVLLSELLERPELLEPPPVVLPRLAWAGRLTLLASEEKRGKSTLAGQGAACLTLGRDFLGEPVPVRPVVWLPLDEPLGDLARRFHRFGAREGVAILTERPDLVPLARTIEEVGAGLLVVDTLTEYALDVVDDFNAAEGWAKVLRGLRQMAQATECAVLLLHHVNRASGKYRGSSQLGAGVDAIIEMGEDPQDSTVRVCRSRGRVVNETFRLRWDGAGGYELEGPAPTIEQRILAAVQATPGVTVRGLRAAVGARAADHDAVVDRLLGSGRLENRPDGKGHHYFVRG